MEQKKDRRHPAEDAFLTNPIPSVTEATGCAPRVVSTDADETAGSAPVKGVPTPEKNDRHKTRDA